MPGRKPSSPLFAQRRAGILLHPTSLPGAGWCGTLGENARRFVDFLHATGCTLWQMLPTGPTHEDGSPYQSLSAHAGSPDLIDLEWLAEKSWIAKTSVPATIADRNQARELRSQLAQEFFAFLESENGAGERERYDRFCQENQYWLDDFALFLAIRESQGDTAWNHWPAALRQRQAKAIGQVRTELQQQLQRCFFEQYAFAQQWLELRSYAAAKHVHLFGDLPIFVAHDSADVWAHQTLFSLDGDGNPLTVAGVPPDYFSETGQHWGNPHYNWPAMEKDGFRWWLARFRSMLQNFDLIRVDHFRGFESYWEIPAGAPDARGGRWVAAPGRALLSACFQEHQELPLVAENLGLITDAVEELRHEFGLPGMRVLQFAFDGNPYNPHLPHNHDWLEVVYTGTHDNDTSVGWHRNLPEQAREHVERYLGQSSEAISWSLIRAAIASVSQMSIIPLQDLLGLGSEARMNTPGTMGANWSWRFDWHQLSDDESRRLRELLELYGRMPH